MINKERIKTFVRETLGCGCPEEVFQYIDCQSDIQTEDIRLRARINVGNRLLIYIADADDPKSLRNLLPRLLEIGRKERDRLGFNRFRLVLTADHTGPIAESAGEVFRDDASVDEKMHLHVVRRTDAPV
jgi:hypothetical protein